MQILKKASKIEMVVDGKYEKIKYFVNVCHTTYKYHLSTFEFIYHVSTVAL